MANRNRKVMSRALFERLIVAADQRGAVVQAEEQARFIKRLSVADSLLMAEAEASVLSLSRSRKLVRIRWEGDTFIVVFGFGEPDPVPLALEYWDITPGIFAIGVLEANLPPSPSVTGAEIRNAIEVEHAGVAGYEGHELAAIASLFPVCLTLRVSSPEPYVASDYRILGALLARSYSDGPLHIDPPTLQRIASLFESGPEFVPYHNLLQGLLSFSWENFFLETYRCLEQLYAQPRVTALMSVWPSLLATKQVVALLEQHLSWRPKEDEALAGLIGVCDSASVQSICTAFGVLPSAVGGGHSSEMVAARIYKLRNSIVHYRPIHESVRKPDDEWNALLYAMLGVVDDVYTKLGSRFFGSAPIA